MSLNKAILHGKEHRKPYRNSKRFDKTCRNHGSCDWCRMNRQHKNLKKMQESIDKMLEEQYNNIKDKDKERIDGYDDKRAND